MVGSHFVFPPWGVIWGKSKILWKELEGQRAQPVSYLSPVGAMLLFDRENESFERPYSSTDAYAAIFVLWLAMYRKLLLYLQVFPHGEKKPKMAAVTH